MTLARTDGDMAEAANSLGAEDYFSHPRPEVRALLEARARFVVDVGCGAGALGAALKREHPGTEVRGIEVDREAAARAARVLDDVAVMPGDGEMPEAWPAPDCIIFADVLEHMIDPWTALRRWRARLAPGGSVIVSLPNVMHVSVLQALRRGRWDYQDEGLLDRTHLRFFTRATAVELLEGAGFAVDAMHRLIRWPHGGLGGRLLRLCIRWGLSREARGRRLPAWLLRLLDQNSAQLVFRGRAAPPRTAASPSKEVA